MRIDTIQCSNKTTMDKQDYKTIKRLLNQLKYDMVVNNWINDSRVLQSISIIKSILKEDQQTQKRNNGSK